MRVRVGVAALLCGAGCVGAREVGDLRPAAVVPAGRGFVAVAAADVELPLRPPLARRPSRGERIAHRAARLVGLRSLKRVSREVSDDCIGLVRLVAEPEGVVLIDDTAHPGDNGVTAIFRRARAAGALHGGRPVPGDLVFFRETYDRNRNGRRDDGLTHIGVVQTVAEDGTITFVHRCSRGVILGRMNPEAPRDRSHNDCLRRADRRHRSYLAGELFAGYASIARLGEPHLAPRLVRAPRLPAGW